MYGSGKFPRASTRVERPMCDFTPVLDTVVARSEKTSVTSANLCNRLE
jgi:hypothetical protein